MPVTDRLNQPQPARTPIVDRIPLWLAVVILVVALAMTTGSLTVAYAALRFAAAVSTTPGAR